MACQFAAGAGAPLLPAAEPTEVGSDANRVIDQPVLIKPDMPRSFGQRTELVK